MPLSNIFNSESSVDAYIVLWRCFQERGHCDFDLMTAKEEAESRTFLIPPVSPLAADE